jgi:branched-chain amino acid transport system substrate-binding protein
MVNSFRRLALVAGSVLFVGAAQAQEEVKIGAIAPLSGGGTAWGLALQRGVQIAIDEVNTAGGLKIGGKSYTPKLVIYDSQYTAAGGRVAAERLINLEKIKFVIGPIGSPEVLGAVPVATQGQAVMISNGFATNILKNDSKAPFNFRALNTSVEFGPSMVKWYRQNHPKARKVALIGPNDAVGQMVIPQMAEVYKASGFEVWSELYERGSKEFTPILLRMLAQNVDLFDLGGNAPGEVGLLVKQARQAGFKAHIWQVGGPAVDETIAIAGPLAEGYLSFNVFDFSAPEAQGFVRTYRAKYGDGVINAQTPLWHNAAHMMFEAMRRAGSLDPTAVRNALEKLEGFDVGLMGPVVWGGTAEYGVAHQLLHKFLIVEVKDGKIVTRATLTPEKR